MPDTPDPADAQWPQYPLSEVHGLVVYDGTPRSVWRRLWDRLRRRDPVVLTWAPGPDDVDGMFTVRWSPSGAFMLDIDPAGTHQEEDADEQRP